MTRTLPIRPQLLATGQAATLAFAVYADDGTTVLVARDFGHCVEVGNACYRGPSVAVDATASGSIRYDYGGDANTVGTVAYEEPFHATADPHVLALQAGDMVVNGDGSWTYRDPGTSTPRVTFAPAAAPGGRAVTLH